MSTPHPYHRLSAADKEEWSLDQIREPDIACPHCETRTTVDDLLAHLTERCPGRRPPHPCSRWVTPQHAAELVTRTPATVRRWVRQGLVLAEGRATEKRYLKRDLVRLAALRRRPSERGGVGGDVAAQSCVADERQLELPWTLCDRGE